jgi:hypothetical protein
VAGGQGSQVQLLPQEAGVATKAGAPCHGIKRAVLHQLGINASITCVAKLQHRASTSRRVSMSAALRVGGRGDPCQLSWLAMTACLLKEDAVEELAQGLLAVKVHQHAGVVVASLNCAASAISIIMDNRDSRERIGADHGQQGNKKHRLQHLLLFKDV